MNESPKLLMPKRLIENRAKIPHIHDFKKESKKFYLYKKLARLLFLIKAFWKISVFVFKRPFLDPFDGGGVGCIQPFYNFEIYPDGQARTCISTIMAMKIGRVTERPILQIFNSIEAKLVRISMYQKEYTYCSKSCPVFNENRFHKIDRKFIEEWEFLRSDQRQVILNKRLTIKNGPSKISDNANVACNIGCEFCFLPVQTNEIRVINEMTNYIIHHKDELKIVHFCGGEPLMQQSTKKILREYQNLNSCKFEFVTSLSSLDHEMRGLLSRIPIHYFNVSVNAANAQTYQKTIARGDWAALQQKIEIIYALSDGRMYMSFVVTKHNFHEIAEFARYASERKVTSIHFHTLKPGPDAYRALSLGTFEAQAVLNQLDHPVFCELGDKVHASVLREQCRGLIALAPFQ